MACKFHPEAKRELFEVVAHYDSIDLDLGNRFIKDVEQTLDRIEQFP